MSAANYTFAFVNGSLSITPATLTVTANTATKVYGQANPTFTDTITGFVNNDSSSVVSGSASLTTNATTASGVGSYTITAAIGSLSAANYTFAFVNGSLSITPATLTITANNATKIYGAALPALSASYSGFVDGDTSASLTTQPTLTTTATASSPVGSYPITASGAADQNYSITYVAGSLTLAQAKPIITWGTPSPITSGTALSSAQLDASANVAGTFSYGPAAGTVLSVGTQTLSLTFTPTDTTDYTTATDSVQLVVNSTNNIATTITGSSSGSLYFGQALQVSASVTSSNGTPTGNVSVFDTTTNESIGNFNLTNGLGELSTSSLTPGKQTITLSFQGTGSYLNSSTSLPVTIVDSIYILNPSSINGALSLSGSAAINVPGLVAVDSTSKSALTVSGAPSVKAGAIQIVGGDSLSGSPYFSVKPVTGAVSSSDPLATLIANNLPLSSGSASAINVSGASSLTINPGLYSAITVSGSGKLTLNPGTYVIAGGGFNVSGAGVVTGTGVTIFNLANNSGGYGSMSITGSGNVNLTAPTAGIFAGIVIVQPTANAKAINVSGAAILNLNGGVFYAAGATINVSGSAQFPTNAVVANELQLSGAAGFNALTDNTTAFSPDQIRTAYGINALTLDGSGQTIAIIDAYDDPVINQALDTFDSQFSTTSSGPTLFDQYGPASSFLTVMNQEGQTSNLPATDPAGAGTSNWETEEALDVEWAHALAPGAQILLVEANSQSLSDLMSAVVTAAKEPNVSVVSMSWGFVEGVNVVASDEAQYDGDFTTPAGHQGVTFVASTGDYGAAVPEYPAYSPNVVAVGGTSLYLNSDNSYNSESGWGYYSNAVGAFIGGGGGASMYESEPAYQQGVQSTGYRTAPDVSFVADPSTGVWLADPYNLPGSNPWETVGGTSLAAPAWASLFALANQGRVAAGEGTLGSSADSTATQEALYNLPQSDFNSVTSGYNGFSAGSGYNLVTGLGTPIVNQLIPDLIASTVSTNSQRTVTVATSDLQAYVGVGGNGGVPSVINVFDAVIMPSQERAAGFGQALKGIDGTSAGTGTPVFSVGVLQLPSEVTNKSNSLTHGRDQILEGSTDKSVSAILLNQNPNSLSGIPANQSLAAGNAENFLLLNGGSNNDTLFESDLLLAGSGSIVTTSGTGNDVLVGGEGSDLVIGAEGHDLIIGGFGSSTLQDALTGMGLVDLTWNAHGGSVDNSTILKNTSTTLAEKESSSTLTDEFGITIGAVPVSQESTSNVASSSTDAIVAPTELL